MTFEKNEARTNFLKYAFTSIDKDHIIPESYRNSVLNNIKNGEHIEDIEELLFQTGVINCLKLSKRKGREKIDEKTIDEYFLGPHNKISDCKAYVGTVKKLNKNSTRVEIADCSRSYKTFLEPQLKLGDKVIVHGRYVIKAIE